MITKLVDGITAHGTPLPAYPRGAMLLAELAAIAAPALAGIVPSIEGSGINLATGIDLAALLGKLDAAKVLVAIGDALGKLLRDDPGRAERVIGELLRCVVVELPAERGGVAQVELTGHGNIGLVVGHSYSRLGLLILFSLEVNFGGFFGGASSAPSPAVGTAVHRTG